MTLLSSEPVLWNERLSLVLLNKAQKCFISLWIQLIVRQDREFGVYWARRVEGGLEALGGHQRPRRGRQTSNRGTKAGAGTEPRAHTARDPGASSSSKFSDPKVFFLEQEGQFRKDLLTPSGSKVAWNYAKNLEASKFIFLLHHDIPVSIIWKDSRIWTKARKRELVWKFPQHLNVERWVDYCTKW